MRQVFQKIPVYTGDVSGVCSALYELGGMVVMHDPSGCNSTYNTHDEIRWYDRDSLIFLSGLDEMDAIMGNDERLIHDIVEAAKIYAPKFIAIVNSPIPYIIGEDFDAICRVVEQETDIPAFYVSTNGMHDYVRGAGLAFLRIAELFAGKGKVKKTDLGDQTSNQEPAVPIRCNLLGMTPLDFAASSTLDSLYEKIKKAGMEVVSCWAMGSPVQKDNKKKDQKEDQTGNQKENPKEDQKEDRKGNPKEEQKGNQKVDLLEGIRRSDEADVTLLLSSTGLLAAQYLEEKFGIPFVAGIPCVGAEEDYFEAVREAARTGQSSFPFKERKPDKEKNIEGKIAARRQVCLIGEPVVMTSLAASIEKRTGACTHVYGATEGAALFLGRQDAALSGEEELSEALKDLVGFSRETERRTRETAHSTREIENDTRKINNGTRETVQGSQKTEETAGSPSEPVLVVADPSYAPVLPEGCELARLSHLAFSGRIFLREIQDLMGDVIARW